MSDEDTRAPPTKVMAKANAVRYSFNWNQELSRLLGTYSFFISNNRIYRACANLHQATLHVMQDPQKRVFIVDGRVDEEVYQGFSQLADRFGRLYGIPPSREPFKITSLLDIKPREKPDLKRQVVTIPKAVSFLESWGDYPPEWVVFNAGFNYKVTSMTPQGFPVTETVSMIDPNDPELENIVTNTISYTHWEEEMRRLMTEILPVAKSIETVLARYLHREGMEYVPTAEDVDSIDDLTVDDNSDDAGNYEGI